MAKQDLSKQIATILLRTRDEIRANMSAQGINASGRTSAALQVRETEGGVQLYKAAGNNAPFATLQYGRTGGKVPSGFYEILKEWSRVKGIAFGSEKERNTFAYFLARKIAREGTQRHQQPRTDIYTPPLNNAVERIRDAASEYVFGQLKAQINRKYI